MSPQQSRVRWRYEPSGSAIRTFPDKERDTKGPGNRGGHMARLRNIKKARASWRTEKRTEMWPGQRAGAGGEDYGQVFIINIQEDGKLRQCFEQRSDILSLVLKRSLWL